VQRATPLGAPPPTMDLHFEKMGLDVREHGRLSFREKAEKI
jgi:hypothetical protein